MRHLLIAALVCAIASLNADSQTIVGKKSIPTSGPATGPATEIPKGTAPPKEIRDINSIARRSEIVNRNAWRTNPAIARHLRKQIQPNPILPKVEAQEIYISPLVYNNKALDDSIATSYHHEKSKLISGEYDGTPHYLLKLTDYAVRTGDKQFVIMSFRHIMNTCLTPELLYFMTREYPSLNGYVSFLSTLLMERGYKRMVIAKSRGIDCDSVRMLHGDTLLMVTGQFMPALNPLVEIGYFYNPTRLVERYKAAADTVIANLNLWTPTFKEMFFFDFLATLQDAGEYHTVLDYFDREPLRQYPDSVTAFAVELYNCAVKAEDPEKSDYYHSRISAPDPATGE